jgi:hypothetical protein
LNFIGGSIRSRYLKIKKDGPLCNSGTKRGQTTYESCPRNTHNYFHGIILLNCTGESCIRPDFPETHSKTIGRDTTGDHQKTGDHKDRPYGTDIN